MLDHRNAHQDHHHERNHGHAHVHTHGAVDPSILTTQRGIWAIKWSFIGLFATAAFQIVIVMLSGSVALLADTIHNIGDAATAIPLWVDCFYACKTKTQQEIYLWLRSGGGLGRCGHSAYHFV